MNSGVGAVPVQVAIANTDTEFGRARFDLSQLTVRPLDPQADEALGTNPLGILRSTDVIQLDLNDGAGQFETGAVLTVGPYQVLSVVLSNLEFEERQRTGAATCEEYTMDYPNVPGPVFLGDFAEPVYLEVTLGSGGEFRLAIDGQALVDAYVASWRCAPGPTLCGASFCFEPWCICDASFFNQSTFSELSPTFLSFP